MPHLTAMVRITGKSGYGSRWSTILLAMVLSLEWSILEKTELVKSRCMCLGELYVTFAGYGLYHWNGHNGKD